MRISFLIVTSFISFILVGFLFASCSPGGNSKDEKISSEILKDSGIKESKRESSASNPASSDVGKDGKKIYGKVFIVDSRGVPLEKIGAIATFKPNAFDEPFAWGTLSGKDGVSEIWVPRNTHLYIRAWDPELRYFPNNFYEIPPTDADALEDMTINMMESSAIEINLVDSEDKTIKNENVGLMMVHPKYGAWWPCDGYTDGEGNVIFKPLPPGLFDLIIKTERGIILEIKKVSLPPNTYTVLGKVKPS
ncbi:MAG: hypothetical protein N3G21_00555 [Candidatus Hydrogenedentes bacterium]|nr:hypothetical protein [Candidatus Hydrogenedentota bacterium]